MSSQIHRRRAGIGRRLKNEMNVVPYIDVMLVLLVIFMVTAPLLAVGNIDLPSAGGIGQIPQDPIEIQVQVDGQISLRLRQSGKDFHAVERDQLIKAIRELSNTSVQTPIVISADGHLAYQEVIELMDFIRQAGFQKIGLLLNEKR